MHVCTPAYIYIYSPLCIYILMHSVFEVLINLPCLNFLHVCIYLCEYAHIRQVYIHSISIHTFNKYAYIHQVCIIEWVCTYPTCMYTFYEFAYIQYVCIHSLSMHILNEYAYPTCMYTFYEFAYIQYVCVHTISIHTLNEYAYIQ